MQIIGGWVVWLTRFLPPLKGVGFRAVTAVIGLGLGGAVLAAESFGLSEA